MIKRHFQLALQANSYSGTACRFLAGYPIPSKLSQRCIFIACFPKSGSTYMARLLEAATHRIGLKAAYIMGHNEQNIDEFALTRCVRKLSVVQQHTQGGSNNVALLAKFHLQPIVLIRSLPDIVFSLQDHLHLHRHTRNSMAFAPSNFFEWTHEEQLRWITWAYMPWYFSFYQSWKSNGGQINAHWVEFTELIANPVDVICKLLDQMSLKYDLESLKRSSDPHNNGKFNRINKGIIGRGSQLSEELITHLWNLADAWKLTDEDRKLLGLKRPV
jgi:hypothetical protein